MKVDRARFDQGMTYDDFKAQMTRNRERVEENERRVDISPNDLAAFRGLPKPIHTLVLAEDWCGDVIANLPVLARLAQESGKLDVRVFLRDQNDDIMQGHLNQGQYKSIPVFVFFDGDFREIGHWIQRLGSIELIPWEGGTFDVSVDGELVHSMSRDGGFPEHEAVKRAVRARLS